MDVKKISRVCQPVRIVVGSALIGYGLFSHNLGSILELFL